MKQVTRVMKAVGIMRQLVDFGLLMGLVAVYGVIRILTPNTPDRGGYGA